MATITFENQIQSPFAGGSQELDDQTLMERLQQGDETALERLMARHQRSLQGYVARILRDEETARETVQDAFMNVYRHASRFVPKAKFTSWLFRIAHNLAVSHLRKRRLETISLSADASDEGTGLDLPAGGLGQDEIVLGRQHMRLIEAELAKLPEPQREAFVLFDVEGLSTREVADRTNAPEGTVKARIFRARRALRQGLSELHGQGAPRRSAVMTPTRSKGRPRIA